MDTDSFPSCSTLETAIISEAGGKANCAGLTKRMWDFDMAPA